MLRPPASACRSSISVPRPAATVFTAPAWRRPSSAKDAEEKRPTVQVGDPFSEKLLFEACLEIMAKGCVIAIQDMGAAGLTCSAVEMGAKGDLGVDARPRRRAMPRSRHDRLRDDALGEPGAHADGAQARKGSERPRRSSVNGASTSPSSAALRRPSASSSAIGGDVMADLPIKELGDEAPVYKRPFTTAAKQPLSKW